MFDIFKNRRMNLNQGLYSSTYILLKYRKEDALRELSKKQLEKVTDTLDKELQFQISKNSGFLTFLGLILVVIFFIMPIISNGVGGGEFTIIEDEIYRLESVDVKMVGEEYKNYPDGVTGTYKIFPGFEDMESSVKVGIILYLLICIYYITSLLYTKKIYKIYNRARYICSLK